MDQIKLVFSGFCFQIKLELCLWLLSNFITTVVRTVQRESLISVLLYLPPFTYPSLGRGRGSLLSWSLSFVVMVLCGRGRGPLRSWSWSFVVSLFAQWRGWARVGSGEVLGWSAGVE